MSRFAKKLQKYHFHLIGIGGIGMSAIAKLLYSLGHKVTGSDQYPNAQVHRLLSQGISVRIGHDANLPQGVTHVVLSSAIAKTNPERKIAKERGIPLITRGKLLADLMRAYHGIAVAGTHGKTTTTALLAFIFEKAGTNPTYTIGGCLSDTGFNARLGNSHRFITEADESDASFLKLSPNVSVVTNIDTDHMGMYNNNFEELYQSFSDYLEALPYNGIAILGIDDPVVRGLSQAYRGNVMTYATDEPACVMAKNIHSRGLASIFEVHSEYLSEPLLINLPLPGRYNVQNALAAISVALYEGLSPAVIKQSIEQFQGVDRRAQVIARSFEGLPIIALEDYGHHPREIEATWKAMQMAWPDRRLIWIFQPHRYTRTQDLFDSYVNVLSHIKHLVLMEVYSAGESVIKQASACALSNAIAHEGVAPPVLSDAQSLRHYLSTTLQADDVVIFQGAGNIGTWAKEILVCEIEQSA